MIWYPWQLTILSIINLVAGLVFGYLFKKYSYKVDVEREIEKAIKAYIETLCKHDWGLYTDPRRDGNPFVRQCEICKKTEYSDF